MGRPSQGTFNYFWEAQLGYSNILGEAQWKKTPCIIILTENFSERNEPHDSIKGRWQPGCNGNKVWSELNVALHSHQQPGLGREKKEEGIRFAWLRLYTKMKSKLSAANKSSVLKTPCPYHLLLEVVQSRLQWNLSGSCSRCSCGDSICTLLSFEMFFCCCCQFNGAKCQHWKKSA